jgi:hypothetical protein
MTMTDAPPLTTRLLIPLIRTALKDADVAADNAAKSHRQVAGEKMLEAWPQFTDRDKFYAWVRRNFRVEREQAKVYMKIADAAKYAALEKKDSDDLHRRLFGDEREPIKIDEATNARWAAADARREAWMAESRERATEREAQNAILKKMLDTGYKVLATKMHPDKGGSAEDMKRLNAVRHRARKENNL